MCEHPQPLMASAAGNTSMHDKVTGSRPAAAASLQHPAVSTPSSNDGGGQQHRQANTAPQQTQQQQPAAFQQTGMQQPAQAVALPGATTAQVAATTPVPAASSTKPKSKRLGSLSGGKPYGAFFGFSSVHSAPAAGTTQGSSRSAQLPQHKAGSGSASKRLGGLAGFKPGMMPRALQQQRQQQQRVPALQQLQGLRQQPQAQQPAWPQLAAVVPGGAALHAPLAAAGAAGTGAGSALPGNSNLLDAQAAATAATAATAAAAAAAAVGTEGASVAAAAISPNASLSLALATPVSHAGQTMQQMQLPKGAFNSIPQQQLQDTPSPTAAAAAAGAGGINGIMRVLGTLGKRSRSSTPALEAAPAATAPRSHKRVRFNDAVQVFVLPPRDQQGASAAAAAAAAGEGEESGVLSDYQQQLQQEHGQWFSSSIHPLSRRQAAKQRREQAAAAAAAAAVAAITGENGSSNGSAAAAGGSRSGSKQKRTAAQVTVNVLGSPNAGQHKGGKRRAAAAAAAAAAAPTDAGAAAPAAFAATGNAAAADSEFIAAAEEDEEPVVELDFEDPNAAFSPWHKTSVQQVGAQLLPGTPEAEEIEAMLRDEEGLEESIVTGLMTYFYKEPRLPTCEVLQSRIQRYKEVIAPYRMPAMLDWLRRNPRMLHSTASTLSRNLSGTLAALSPGLMLPDKALELLGKCPALLTRAPAGVQAKLEVMVQLFGRDNVGPLLLRMPAMLTVSLPRLLETLPVMSAMMSDPHPYGVLLQLRLAPFLQQQQPAEAKPGSSEQQQQSEGAQRQQQPEEMQQQQHKQEEGHVQKPQQGQQQQQKTQQQQPQQQQPQLEPHQQQQQEQEQQQQQGHPQPEPQQQQQQDQAQQQQPHQQQQDQAQQQQLQQGHPQSEAPQQQQQQYERVSPMVLAFMRGYPAICIKPTNMVRTRYQRMKALFDSWTSAGGCIGPAATDAAAAADAADTAAAAGAAAAPPAATFVAESKVVAECDSAPTSAAAKAAMRGTAAAVDGPATAAAAAAGEGTAALESTAAAAAATAAAVELLEWLASTGATQVLLNSLMSPLMLSDVQYELLEHRAEYLLAAGQQATVQLWRVLGPNAASFEERYPGFVAWREQHKGVAADATLGLLTRSQQKGKRKRGGKKTAA